MSDMLTVKTAIISDCGRYRYRLTRSWADGREMTFVMLNPSTADADVDDPTIRRCMGFARRDGFGSIAVVNLFALRATKPDVLASHDSPWGSANFAALGDVLESGNDFSSPIICAWGAHSFAANTAKTFAERAKRHKTKLLCLGKTRDGSPRHPLYVRADQPFEAFP